MSLRTNYCHLLPIENSSSFRSTEQWGYVFIESGPDSEPQTKALSAVRLATMWKKHERGYRMRESVRLGLRLRKTKKLVAFLVTAGALTIVAGCGGGSGGGGGSTSSNPTVISVTASCSPASISTSQTSTCSATVTGTGSYSSAVTWSVSPTSIGTVSSAGVFTPSGAGAATITATSTQDATKSGTATVTVTPPPTIASVSVSCSPTTVPEGQTSTCTATVQGTGNFDPTVIWAAGLGTVSSAAKDTGTYVAPSSVTGPVTVTATSSEDTTKSGTAALVVTRTPPSGSWQRTGPPGASLITVLAADPSSSGTIYADGWNAGASGLWKSVDAGRTWTAMVTNSFMDASPIGDLVVVNGGQTFYAADSEGPYIYASIDGGATWTSSQLTSTGDGYRGMAVDPQNFATIYLSAPGQGVFKSTDSGKTWNLLPSSPVTTAGSDAAIMHNAILVDPTNSSTVYYGTDHGFYISKDGGTTWSASANGIASTDVSIRDVAVDAAAPSTIFILAGAEGLTTRDLYRSTNGGSSWTPLATGLDAQRIVPDSSNSSIIYHTGLACHAVYKSTDGGLTFAASDSGTPTNGNTCGGGPTVVSGPTGVMVPVASNPNTFLLSIEGAGLYRTQDGAQSWSSANSGLSAWNGDAVAVDPQVPTTVYFGALNGGGIFKSTDTGLSWSNLRHDGAYVISVDPFDSNHILVAAWNEGLIESHDGGNTWVNVGSSLPPVTKYTVITGITFHPKQKGLIFVATESGGMGLVRSSDGGSTYTAANAGLSSTDVGGCFAVNPQNPQMLLIADGAGTAISTDEGNTWVETASQVTCPFSVDAKATPAIVYATGPNGGVRSTDFGKTWSAVNTIGTLLADPSTAYSVFALGMPSSGPDIGAWSPDAGVTWYPLLTSGLGQTQLDPGGLESSGLLSNGGGMVIAPTSPQVLFVTSWTNSLLRFEVGP